MDEGLQVRAEPFAIAAIEAIASLQYYCLAAAVLLYYDFTLTIGQEIERIWKQKLSIVSCIFFLNRYLTVLGYIPVVYFVFSSPVNDRVSLKFAVCTTFVRFPGSLSTITQFFIVVLLVMRVYALYQGKTWVLLMTVPLGALTVGIAAWNLAQVQATNLSFGPLTLFQACVPADLKTSRCMAVSYKAASSRPKWLLSTYSLDFKASWIINGVFDTVVFVLTVYKTYALCREHRRVGVQSDLVQLLMRDGAMFFAALALANLINATLFLSEENAFFEQSAGNNSVLTHTLSSTLLSRLILNLRGAGPRTNTDPVMSPSRFSSAPHEDIMLVSSSTFSNSTTLRSMNHPWSSTPGSTVVGSVERTLPMENPDSRA